MIFDYILYSIALLGLLVGSYSDLKTKEVPDWVSYGMIFSGLGLRLIYSLMEFQWTIFFEGLVGFLVFITIAYLMYYLGQWGGGDAKLLMGLGALIGLQFHFEPLPKLALFFINLLVIGAIYGLGWTFSLALIHKNKFWPEAQKNMQKTKGLFLFTIILSLIPTVASFFYQDITLTLLILGVIPVGSFMTWLVIKSVEQVCFYKNISPENLTIGDWIVKDIIIDNQKICGPKDLGIEKNQINKLIKLKHQGKINKILIKEGIPFVPSFLIAFILLITVNWLAYLI